MVIKMDESQLRTIEQIEQFLTASAEVAFAAHGDDVERYACQRRLNIDPQWVSFRSAPTICEGGSEYRFDQLLVGEIPSSQLTAASSAGSPPEVSLATNRASIGTRKLGSTPLPWT